MGDSGGDGGGGNCTRVDLGEGLTICLRSKPVGKHSIPVLKWHGRPARESRARCACHIQTALLPSPYLALLLGNITRPGAALSSASSFLISRVLTRPAPRGRTRQRTIPANQALALKRH